MTTRHLELLSPAANAETAIAAIKHGADAVYIGPPSHGARKSVANSIEDIGRVADFAHQFGAKVYATVNTLVYDSEIKKVETLCNDLYHCGVDALIIQDMGILKMKLPPIALHASTQCDIRTPEKAKFLQDVGFSQIVLARELTVPEIKAIVQSVSIPVETFVHGALCVCYSGCCNASFALTGRSGNRGECAQICRLPFSLIDNKGNYICKDKHLLSLQDFNAAHNLKDLIDAGVSSFKIEGRLKEIDYVKNITGFYNLKLNEIIRNNPEKYTRSSFGEVELNFTPQPDKSFNRGFTSYFLHSHRPRNIASLETPKSKGELIHEISQLNNGDGISFFDRNGNFTGVNVNKIQGNKIIPARKVEIPKGAQIFRTSDIKWGKMMTGDTARRLIKVDIEITDSYIKATDVRGISIKLPLDLEYSEAQKPQDYRPIFEKLGNTIFKLRNFTSSISPSRFYRASEMTDLRRKLIELLSQQSPKVEYLPQRVETSQTVSNVKNQEEFNISKITSTNVSNHLAREFYLEHGLSTIESAAEVLDKYPKERPLMTTRHCILRELGLCKKNYKPDSNISSTEYYLESNGRKFPLTFDCVKCEMHVNI